MQKPSPSALRWLADRIESERLPSDVMVSLTPAGDIDLHLLAHGDLILDGDVQHVVDEVDAGMAYQTVTRRGVFGKQYGQLRRTAAIDGTDVTITVKCDDYSGVIFA